MTRYNFYHISTSPDSNVFCYVGHVDSCERKEYVKANKRYVVSNIVAKHTTEDGVEQVCAFNIPPYFDLEKIQLLRKVGAECEFHFTIQSRKYAGFVKSFLHCIAIRPKGPTYEQFAQQIPNPKYLMVIKGNYKDVDADGFSYPYDY